MKLNFLKLKRNKLPPLESLRPPIFNTDSFWFAGLGLCFVVLIITGFIGFKLFYSQYFETYKQTSSSQNYENLINVNGLNNAIQKRASFINSTSTIPKDPSL